MTVIRTTLDRVLARINAIGRDGAGWTRPSYSALETAAHDVVAEEATALGLAVHRDAAGNLFARLPGRDRTAPAIHVGSHLDTVAQGGAFDGQAGVAGGLALIAALKADGRVPPVDIVLTVTRAEESVWFPASYLGSRALLGRWTRADLEVRRSDTGRTLADHMRDLGLDPEAALQTAPPPPARFVELHIEQGPVLHKAGESHAIVTGVRGGFRHRAARIQGIWAHSGGAPRADRADAVFALADLVHAMDAEWGQMLAAGDDLAVTFGIVDAAGPQHAMAKVPGAAGFCVDLRSDREEVLERAHGRLLDHVARIEAARPGIRFDLGAESRSTPVALSRAWQEDLSRAAGGTLRAMPSGGGHDAAAFAAAGWDATMLFIRNWNGSHCPEEGMDPADLALAVGTLRDAILEDPRHPSACQRDSSIP
ncbi:hydantoinase/carbamoylase family amidase [Falsirhodobacter halotolerans]|uniref:hydantoinase/carbamoylase family amidase n=1 Tax=Falsirhodobacter halotolerans TaxID=1146892 RepID=UPI001FD49EB8|nr:hydantoinase/carbamoylase family amidase [Falsirhodobacter halotolerans]MCJ8140876.1 hydantoinase/carbamoylase family amidase [Falsirhodobacter halotolerans]